MTNWLLPITGEKVTYLLIYSNDVILIGNSTLVFTAVPSLIRGLNSHLAIAFTISVSVSTSKLFFSLTFSTFPSASTTNDTLIVSPTCPTAIYGVSTLTGIGIFSRPTNDAIYSFSDTVLAVTAIVNTAITNEVLMSVMILFILFIFLFTILDVEDFSPTSRGANYARFPQIILTKVVVPSGLEPETFRLKVENSTIEL